jgi:hypothetical protein
VQRVRQCGAVVRHLASLAPIHHPPHEGQHFKERGNVRVTERTGAWLLWTKTENEEPQVVSREREREIVPRMMCDVEAVEGKRGAKNRQERKGRKEKKKKEQMVEKDCLSKKNRRREEKEEK